MKETLFFTAIIVILAYGLSWTVTVGIIKLITLCFAWKFNLLYATGIWLIILIARTIFGSSSSKKD